MIGLGLLNRLTNTKVGGSRTLNERGYGECLGDRVLARLIELDYTMR